jgi:hypothetical protein
LQLEFSQSIHHRIQPFVFDPENKHFRELIYEIFINIFLSDNLAHVP